MIKTLVSGMVLIFLVPLYALGATAISASPAGLTSLTHNGVEFLGKGGRDCVVTMLGFDNNRVMTGDLSPGNSGVTSGPSQVTISRRYRWGALRCIYTVNGDRVQINVYVVNNTQYTVGNLGVQVIPLISPTEAVTQMPATKYDLEGPEALFIPYGRVKLFVADEEVAKLLNISQARFPGGILILFTTTAAHLARPHYGTGPRPRVVIGRPISPRNSDHFSLSMRFAETGESPNAVLSDLFARWVAAFPFNLSWPDRRPIGILMLASNGRLTPLNLKNPRFWRFLDPGLDINSQTGRTEFRTRLFEEADRALANLKGMNAQGVIVWDIEGQQYRNMNYVGDPRYLPPEMQGLAALFFKRFTSAGYRCGMTLRGDRVVVPGGGNQLNPQSYQSYDENPETVFEMLDEKIRYATERFGCSLFYFDSSGTQDWSFDWRVFRRLHAKYPNVLFLPEQKSMLYYTVTAPYCDERGVKGGCPSAEARWLYPKAFSAINLGGADSVMIHDPAKMDPVKRAGHGDIMMAPVWVGLRDSHIGLLREIEESASSPSAHSAE